MRILRREGRDNKFTLEHVNLDVQMSGGVLDMHQHDAQERVEVTDRVEVLQEGWSMWCLRRSYRSKDWTNRQNPTLGVEILSAALRLEFTFSLWDPLKEFPQKNNIQI